MSGLRETSGTGQTVRPKTNTGPHSLRVPDVSDKGTFEPMTDHDTKDGTSDPRNSQDVGGGVVMVVEE